MPLDSHTRVMRPPSITVRGDTSSEPRILGETVIMTGNQREALITHSRYTLVHFTEVKSKSWHKYCCEISVCQNTVIANCTDESMYNNASFLSKSTSINSTAKNEKSLTPNIEVIVLFCFAGNIGGFTGISA